MNLSSLKNNWKMIALSVWAIFSIVYICYGAVQNFQMNVVNIAANNAYGQAVLEVIAQSENKECKPFNIHAGDKKADLINIACLQQAPKTNGTTPAQK